MSDQPTVCAVMLTRDRPELAAKAVECFRRQTYENKRLFIWDTGDEPAEGLIPKMELGSGDLGCVNYTMRAAKYRKPIGGMRNDVIEWAIKDAHADILVHFDDDDWSHPNRITEQVALLQASGADVVGYNEMLFWREGKIQCGLQQGASIRKMDPVIRQFDGEAWLYANTKPPGYALGTSLCYWRKTWEAHHFANETQGVEEHWLREKRVHSVSSLKSLFCASPLGDPPAMVFCPTTEPRMIARIHAGNTSNGYRLEEYAAKGSREWQRVPQWDARVRELLG